MANTPFDLPTLIEALPDGLLVVTADGNISLINAQTQTMFGYHSTELIGQPVERLIPEHFTTQHEAHRLTFLANPCKKPMGTGLALYGKHKDNHEFPVEISLSPLKTETDFVTLVIIRDISHHKKIEETAINLAQQLKDLAEHDALTGLISRSLFFDRIYQGIALSTRQNHYLAVVFIDIDNLDIEISRCHFHELKKEVDHQFLAILP